MYQMAVKYTIWRRNRHICLKKYQHHLLQGLAKFTQIGIIWFENILSGSTAPQSPFVSCAVAVTN
jgi:hypothetical protein